MTETPGVPHGSHRRSLALVGVFVLAGAHTMIGIR
jgi:hypothetical protein